MGFLNAVKGKINLKESVSKVKDKVSSSITQVKEKAAQAKSNRQEASEEEIESKGSQMLKVMDWAFEKATGNIPGLGSSSDMAKKYLDKYGSVNAAINHLVNWQITSAATTGFVTSFGGLPTMAIT